MDDRNRRWWILAVLAAYLILAAILPAIDDEVYYWCWSKELQWSYYDHPPMTAVLMRLSTMVFGDSTFGYRIPACLASAFVLYVISRLTRSTLIFFGVLLSPMFTLGAVVMTPDSPLVMFWAAYLWWMIEVHKLLQQQARLLTQGKEHANNPPVLNSSCDAREPTVPVSVRFWTVGGVILGCGVLSKYTMGLAVPTGFISLLLIWRSWKRWLPGYIYHGIVAFAVASPILIYNINQNFEPLQFQWQHAAEKSKSALMSFGDFAGGQIVLFGTLPFCLAPWVCYSARRLCHSRRLLVCTCFYAIPLFFFLNKSLNTRIQGNWAFVCFVSFWPVASVWYECVRKSRSWRVSTALAFVPPVLATVLGTAHLISPIPVVPIPVDRVYRQIAMNTATREIAQKIREHGEQIPVYASTYQLTALLRFQSLDARQIDGATRPSHFTRPPRHLTDVDRAYFVGGPPLESVFTDGFGPPELIGSVPVQIRGQTDVTFNIWLYNRSGSHF